MSKSGVPGLGIDVVPLMVMVVGNARASAGWLLPTLCTADLFAIAYYRRHAQARRLFDLAPWVLVGMAAGAVALGRGESGLRPILGAVVLRLLATDLSRKWRPLPSPPTR